MAIIKDSYWYVCVCTCMSLNNIQIFFFYILSADIDECAIAPCQNGGTCVDGVNKFQCDCQVEYTGGFCQRKSFQGQGQGQGHLK